MAAILNILKRKRNEVKNKILIYEDIGTAGVAVLKESLKNYFKNQEILIKTVSAEDILTKNVLNSDVIAFFMPGGAADYYHLKLGRKGKDYIRSYVEAGGIYYGICAGAYFASEKAVFEPRIHTLRKISDYGLHLIDAVAIGTLQKELKIKPYEPTADATAVVPLQDADTRELYTSYYHGGPWFVRPKSSQSVVLAYYKLPMKRLPAIIAEKVSKGLVIASGVHYEITGEALEKCLLPVRTDYEKARKVMIRLKRSEYYRQLLFHKMMHYTRN